MQQVKAGSLRMHLLSCRVLRHALWSAKQHPDQAVHLQVIRVREPVQKPAEHLEGGGKVFQSIVV